MSITQMPDLPSFKVVPPNRNIRVDDFKLPDGTPMVGPDGLLVPPARSFNAIINAATRVFSYRFDEAMRDNMIAARAMRRDGFLDGLFEERILPTINREWNLEVDDDTDPAQAYVRDQLKQIISSIPDFDQFKRSNLDAVWFGRSGCQWAFARNEELNDMWGIPRWDPLHGDSIQYTFDGVPAILLDSLTTSWYSNHGASWDMPNADLRPTDRGGNALVLQRPYWRNRFTIHSHIRRKADYFEGELAGSVQGLGLRGQVYWLYTLRTDALTWMIAYMQAVGAMDLLVFNYPAGNDAAKRQQEANANKIIGKAAMVVPRNPQGNWPGIEQVQMNAAGLKALHDLMADYFDRHIERLFVGQSMSSGADKGTGLGGTGRAEFSKATKDEILVHDTNRLDSTFTYDLVRPLKRYNFPWAKFPVRFKSIMPDLKAAEKVEAGGKLIMNGVSLKVDEYREAGGFSRPETGDEVIATLMPGAPPMITVMGENGPEMPGGMMAPPGMMMGGPPPGMGGPPGMPPMGPPGMGGPPGMPPQLPPGQPPLPMQAAGPVGAPNHAIVGGYSRGRQPTYMTRFTRPMQYNHQAFQQAIRQSPHDATNWAVYADWLDENGHPQQAARARWWAGAKLAIQHGLNPNVKNRELLTQDNINQHIGRIADRNGGWIGDLVGAELARHIHEASTFNHPNAAHADAARHSLQMHAVGLLSSEQHDANVDAAIAAIHNHPTLPDDQWRDTRALNWLAGASGGTGPAMLGHTVQATGWHGPTEENGYGNAISSSKSRAHSGLISLARYIVDNPAPGSGFDSPDQPTQSSRYNGPIPAPAPARPAMVGPGGSNTAMPRFGRPGRRQAQPGRPPTDYGRLTLGESRPFRGPFGETMDEHDYHDEQGNKLGVVRIQPRNDGNMLHVHWVGPTDVGGGEQANTVGAEGMRSLQSQLQQRYPNAQFVSGFRAGGFRQGRGGERVMRELQRPQQTTDQPEPTQSARYERRNAPPGGVTYRDKPYRAGQFIPGGVMFTHTPNRPVVQYADADFDPEQLHAGIRHETQYTSDPNAARGRAKHNLVSDPDYYRRIGDSRWRPQRYADPPQEPFVSDNPNRNTFGPLIGRLRRTNRTSVSPGMAMYANPIMYSHPAFQQQIAERPTDAIARAVYADWLEEHDPESVDPHTLAFLRSHSGPAWVAHSPRDGKVQAGRMWTMAQIRDAIEAHGGLWFTPENMAHMNTRLHGQPVHGPGGNYFVTSEQSLYGPRGFTVRGFDPGEAANPDYVPREGYTPRRPSISTFVLNGHPGLDAAQAVAKRFASGRSVNRNDPQQMNGVFPDDKPAGYARVMYADPLDPTDQASFEAAIDANPFDRLNHHVYADWLQDRGHDDEAAFRRSLGDWYGSHMIHNIDNGQTWAYHERKSVPNLIITPGAPNPWRLRGFHRKDSSTAAVVPDGVHIPTHVMRSDIGSMLPHIEVFRPMWNRPGLGIERVLKGNRPGYAGLWDADQPDGEGMEWANRRDMEQAMRESWLAHRNRPTNASRYSQPVTYAKPQPISQNLRAMFLQARQNPYGGSHGYVADAIDDEYPDHPVADLIRQKFGHGPYEGQDTSNDFMWYEPVQNSWDGTFPYTARLGTHGPFDVYLGHEGTPEQQGENQRWIVHAVARTTPHDHMNDFGYTFEFPHDQAHLIPRMFPAARQHIALDIEDDPNSPYHPANDSLAHDAERNREATEFGQRMDEEERNRS